MTRLTADDVGGLIEDLRAFEEGLRSFADFGLRGLALRTAADPPACVPLHGTRMAAVPFSSGEGFIPRFSECVVTILRHLHCDAWVTTQPDIRGLQEAAEMAAEVVFLADDFRFIALNLRSGRCVDDDPATADGYVTALEAAAGGLVGRNVLLLGLGPVGRAAARRLVSRGASVAVVEPDAARLREALDGGLRIRPLSLAEGLELCDLVFDATPAPDFIDAGAARHIVAAAVPGLPSAFTAAAREALGPRHIHEPLAIGVAVMAARALV
ncbi:MAG: 3-methylornithyl-N6-L-lysine dehydrogenase PylD [Thermoleophilia bacterium]